MKLEILFHSKYVKGWVNVARIAQWNEHLLCMVLYKKSNECAYLGGQNCYEFVRVLRAVLRRFPLLGNFDIIIVCFSAFTWLLINTTFSLSRFVHNMLLMWLLKKL